MESLRVRKLNIRCHTLRWEGCGLHGGDPGNSPLYRSLFASSCARLWWCVVHLPAMSSRGEELGIHRVYQHKIWVVEVML